MTSGVYKRSNETKEKMRQRMLRMQMNEHPRYKSDNNICMTQIHKRIRRRLPRPQLCPLCLLKPPEHLSNKTGIYDMNLVNWWYLCVRCHAIYDDRLKFLELGREKLRLQKTFGYAKDWAPDGRC